jgi:mRNA-degrading endonuclease RelE of RelBE toxin-antitoxin system
LIARLHSDFRRCFERLPNDIRERAREAYRRFAADPAHPGLRFKRLHADLPLWSVRITDSYRAVGVRKSDEEIVWIFIGTHAEYDRLLRTL